MIVVEFNQTLKAVNRQEVEVRYKTITNNEGVTIETNKGRLTSNWGNAPASI